MSEDTSPEEQHPAGRSAERVSARHEYWRANVRVLSVLLLVWFLVSYGCGILFVDRLDAVRIPGTGFKLGFWFAQQGSIFVFVALIAVYVRVMNRLDHRFDVEEEEDSGDGGDDPGEGESGKGV